ncbi:MAG: IS30 family transposase [Alcanivoracaceae bacterium]|nr:IS30 family transposase [Alcanivoracaceae bacterium]
MYTLPRKSAVNVSQACIDKLKKELTHTLTSDNGLEFARHEDITQAIGIEAYFAKPYFPKSMQLDQLTDDEIQVVEDALNNRPRKKLGFLTPLEVKSRDWSVALQY